MDQTPVTEENYPLGQPKALYELTPEDSLRFIGFAVVLLILSLGCVWVGLNDNNNSRKLTLIAAGIGLLLGAIYLLYIWYNRRDLHVLVSDDGLTVIENDNMATYRWDDIESIFQDFKDASVYGIRGRTSKIYTLVPRK